MIEVGDADRFAISADVQSWPSATGTQKYKPQHANSAI